MIATRQFACLLLLVASVGCTESGRVHDYLGDKATKVLSAPDRVETYRIEPMRKIAPGTEQLAGFPILAKGADQDKGFSVALGKVLLSDRSYEWEMAKGCMFTPHIAYRVWSGSDAIIVLICFDCNAVGIVPDESQPVEMRIHDDDPARPALLKLAKKAFPQEKFVQDLTE